MTSDKLYEPDYSDLATFLFEIYVSDCSLTSKLRNFKIMFIFIGSIFRMFFLETT